MHSKNFEFLHTTQPDLAALGGFAEHYAFNDPAGALAKLRLFAERTVESIYETFRLPKPYQPNLNDLLNEDGFRERVPPVVQTKLHALRMHGNKAVHANKGTTSTALDMLREAHDIARWLNLTFHSGLAAQSPAYLPPSPPADLRKLERDRQRLLVQIAEQEEQMHALFQQLEQAKAEKLERNAVELQELVVNGNAVAAQLAFDEATTRKRLVDAMLVAAAWHVGDNGTSTEQVGQEVDIPQPQNKTGIGRCDYVLWGDDGKPLAVIESKRTAKDADAGRTQAKLYADGLETRYGQRPVIFYTNGFDIFIWDDAQHHTPRKLFGFYSKESLNYLIFQRREKLPLDTIAPKSDIAGRMYQIESIRRICERLSQGYRKALVVLATGTGKTRVAVSLCEVLSRARWVKRVLFLCDRRELRKQADDVFKEFLPGEPRILVNSNTAGDVTNRIYLATYQAMMQNYELYDVGFFDLIIADESHRGIYNRYRDLFVYFDAIQVGLTATPVQFIARNTFKLFACEDGDPTSYFSYQEAISHVPPYLVPFEVYTHTTEFLRRGIKYAQLSEDQRQKLEEDEGEDFARTVDFEDGEVDRAVFNKDTNRAVLRNLMENGIRNSSASRPGKTILFARNHNHAVLLSELFDEMYPQYGGQFCRVIDTYDCRAEQLIDDFKDPKNPLTLAISVDMLDTGIDVPEVVNLVFAKPVKSWVKFWQMIGRGTRLCLHLFGPGQDKVRFRIFDHWGNFAFFEQTYTEADPLPSRSLLQQLFEARLELADEALATSKAEAFDIAVKLLAADIAALPKGTIAVREKWREVRQIQTDGVLPALSAATRATLLRDIAPLMQWRDTRNVEDAYRLDILIAHMQAEVLKRSAVYKNLRDELMALVARLPVNVNAVREKLPTIEKLRRGDFWQTLFDQADVPALETIREELRGIMRHCVRPTGPTAGKPLMLDIREDADKIRYTQHLPKLAGTELVAYRQRVETVLAALFQSNATLARIRRAEAVSTDDLNALVSLILTQHPDVNLAWLTEFYPDTAGDLATAIRTIVGMEAEVVAERFAEFMARHPRLTARQQRFMALLQNHIARFGVIGVGKLYEAPFTQVSPEGLDGVFDDRAAVELIAVIEGFHPVAPIAAGA
ncbi:type I restriction endonuclease subunit R [Candidatus Accumulibacter aalborgensis]|uniref:type I restriction endonuclease subunit R n=1 Tax=Candidatus Accumulibacter aalborgensis TaxID=1860102 RepID=UPI000B05EA8F|nr:DEAD/DEAH box helicase family protein [Candidatus Accumulibacter aalborgensis]